MLLVAMALSGIAQGQVVRLPSVTNRYSTEDPPPWEPREGMPRGILAGYPSELSQPLLNEGQPSAGPEVPHGVLGGIEGLPNADWTQNPEVLPSDHASATATPKLPRGAKNGFVQQVLVAETYMPKLGQENLGMNDVLVQASFGMPFPTRDAPLLVTPAFEVQMLDGPAAPFLPSQLYDASIMFLHILRFSEKFSLQIGATPGVHSDFEKSSDEAVRVPGRLVGVWEPNDKTQWVLGVLYLDRDDVRYLPAVGVMWYPDDDSIYELLFPRPRIAHRLVYAGDVEWWGYVAGEFGGGTYAYLDPTISGGSVLTLSDWRVLLGLERRVTGGLNSRIEVGYVFNRKVDFANNDPDVPAQPTYEPGSTLLVRGGLTY
jgi:hypothetical protein